MKLLVTGGLGVNGIWVVRDLLSHGHDPVIIDRRKDFSLAPDLEHAVNTVVADITDIERLTRTMQEERIECVIHLAALMPTESQIDPRVGFTVNALGTVHVLEAAKIAGVRRVVFTSSRAYYGKIWGEEFGHPLYTPVPETHPVQPQTVYDISKLSGEIMGLNYQKVYGLEFVALRFGLIYGPGRRSRHGNLAIHSVIVESAFAGQSVRIPQGGDQSDDMIYVTDVAEGTVAAALRSTLGYSAYNISSGQRATLGDFVDTVRKVLPEADIEVGPGQDFFGHGMDYYSVFDVTRARTDLGFEPRMSLEDGVRHYVEFLNRPPAT